MTMQSDLSLALKASELDRDPVKYQLEASDEERAAIVERFGLVSLDYLKADVSIKAKDHGQGVFVSGQVQSKLGQRCIVSLEAVDEVIDEPFELLLVDPELANRMDEDESYLDPDAPEYDALEGDEVHVGEIVAQTLSILMNPYPRADGAEVEAPKSAHVSLNEPELEKPNPFAALSKLKDKS